MCRVQSTDPTLGNEYCRTSQVTGVFCRHPSCTSTCMRIHMQVYLSLLRPHTFTHPHAHTHTHIYIYLYIYIYIHAYTHTRTFTCTHTITYTHMHIHIYKQMYMCVHARNASLRASGTTYWYVQNTLPSVCIGAHGTGIMAAVACDRDAHDQQRWCLRLTQ